MVLGLQEGTGVGEDTYPAPGPPSKAKHVG